EPPLADEDPTRAVDDERRVVAVPVVPLDGAGQGVEGEGLAVRGGDVYAAVRHRRGAEDLAAQVDLPARLSGECRERVEGPRGRPDVRRLVPQGRRAVDRARELAAPAMLARLTVEGREHAVDDARVDPAIGSCGCCVVAAFRPRPSPNEA